MSKKHFIKLAEVIRANPDQFTPQAIATLADFCQGENPAFKRDRWTAYIAGQCGPNGGKVKAS